MKLTTFLTTFFLLLTFVPFVASAGDLTLAGSTTVQKRILEPSNSFIKSDIGLKIKVLGVGSGGGFEMLMKGKVPASIASSPLKSLLKKKGLADDGTYQEHVIIMDDIVPVVHKSNPVSELTFQQLSDIHTGKIKDWKEIGGKG